MDDEFVGLLFNAARTLMEAKEYHAQEWEQDRLGKLVEDIYDVVLAHNIGSLRSDSGTFVVDL